MIARLCRVTAVVAVLMAGPSLAADLAAVEPAPVTALEMWAGGPAPGKSFRYTVKSVGGKVRFAVTGVPDWLTVTPASGIATADGVAVTVRVKPAAARGLSPGVASARLVFADIRDPKDRFERAVQLTAFADPNGGVMLFRQRCSGCHQIDKTADAPKLRDVYGRKAGTEPGFGGYSAALKAYGKPWTYPRLKRWLDDAQALVPGTLMPSFKGLTNRQRHLLIGYLRSVSANPPPH